jgi:DNA mismatch endonuclease (patch repair protein)
MTDVHSPAVRSGNMRAIKGKNTKPEVQVRKFLFKKGFRFRLHSKEIAGRPDIVLPKYKTVIFVHGCFWHRHKNCRFATTPKSKEKFWEKKFSENMLRDEKNNYLAIKTGWHVIIIWECEVKSGSYEANIEKSIKRNGYSKLG